MGKYSDDDFRRMACLTKDAKEMAADMSTGDIFVLLLFLRKQFEIFQEEYVKRTIKDGEILPLNVEN